MRLIIGCLLALLMLTACSNDRDLPAAEREALIKKMTESLRESRIAETVTPAEIANTICDCYKLVRLDMLQDKEMLSKKNNPDSTAIGTEIGFHMACMMTQNMFGDPAQVDSAVVIARKQCPERYAKAENFTKMVGEQLNKGFEELN